jgi:SAM-dependent methyltransferase
VSVNVGWHDVECGGYAADLPLWLELARAAGGPVLDVGAGTGRVALVLAAHGADVTALDLDAELLAELEARAAAAGLRVETVVADATGFDLGGRAFALIAVPMQTIQLLPERDGFFASARRALAPGGLVALALAEAAEPFEPSAAEMPAPDVGEWHGLQLVSQPLAIRLRPGVMRIERMREAIEPDGTRTAAGDAIELALVTREQLAAEAAAHGLRPEPSVHIPPTDDHVGSEVVMLRG